MSKFKINDLVRVKSLKTLGYAGEHRVGHVGRITEVWNNGRSYKVDGEGESCYLSHEDLELAYPNPPHKHADIIKAWADGAVIQYKNSLGSWVDYINPCWVDSNTYRIKPTNPNADKISEIEEKMRKLADELKELKGEN